MKLKKILMCLIFTLIFTSCNSNNSKILEKIENKPFYSKENGQLLILNDNKEKKLSFKGSTVIKPTTNPKKIDEKSVKKEQGGIFKNPQIIVENGKKYITADSFPYKLLIKDDNTIIDEEDNVEYKLAETK